MSIIQATSAGVKDMVDGSLRITLEFEPRHAKEAFSLFGARGTACAIAALTTEAATHAAQQETIAPPAEPKMKPGPLCVMACNFCADPMFWKWIKQTFIPDAEFWPENEDEARKFVLDACEIDSRKKLDQFASAADTFHRDIRKPFLAWKAKQ